MTEPKPPATNAASAWKRYPENKPTEQKIYMTKRRHGYGYGLGFDEYHLTLKKFLGHEAIVTHFAEINLPDGDEGEAE